MERVAVTVSDTSTRTSYRGEAMASTVATTIKQQKVGVIGSGLIGRSWAMLFAAGGYNVSIYDIAPHQVTSALENIKVQLHDLEKQGLLRGSLSVDQQFSRISGTTSLEDCIFGAFYIQECVPEQLDLKAALFKEIDNYCSDTVILASSTSSFPASTFTSDIKHREQVIVSHPTNPPFYCPLVEVCPAPYTREEVTKATMALLEEIGEVPVLIKKEVRGFVLNRLQYALMNECWRLVEDNAISVADLDTVMKDGLGTRYAFTGPMETCHLNAAGMKSYCERYGPGIFNITDGFGPIPKWGGEVGERINREMEAIIPVDTLVERRRWRDKRLAALAVLKKKVAQTK